MCDADDERVERREKRKGIATHVIQTIALSKGQGSAEILITITEEIRGFVPEG
jgi:hypothetical protein